MKHSSFGSVAPKTRTLDVGANLLNEWIEEQARLRHELVRYGLIAAAALVGLVVGGSLMMSNIALNAKRRLVLVRGIERLDKSLEASEKARKEAQPVLLVREMCDKTGGLFDILYGQLSKSLAAGNAHLALSNVREDVQSAEIHLVVQGFGENDASVQAYADAASDPNAKVASITNSRPSDLLGKDGVSFEYVKRIGVKP